MHWRLGVVFHDSFLICSPSGFLILFVFPVFMIFKFFSVIIRDLGQRWTQPHVLGAPSWSNLSSLHCWNFLWAVNNNVMHKHVTNVSQVFLKGFFLYLWIPKASLYELSHSFLTQLFFILLFLNDVYCVLGGEWIRTVKNIEYEPCWVFPRKIGKRSFLRKQIGNWV